jgi:hypothetical protein
LRGRFCFPALAERVHLRFVAFVLIILLCLTRRFAMWVAFVVAA